MAYSGSFGLSIADQKMDTDAASPPPKQDAPTKKGILASDSKATDAKLPAYSLTGGYPSLVKLLKEKKLNSDGTVNVTIDDLKELLKEAGVEPEPIPQPGEGTQTKKTITDNKISENAFAVIGPQCPPELDPWRGADVTVQNNEIHGYAYALLHAQPSMDALKIMSETRTAEMRARYGGDKHHQRKEDDEKKTLASGGHRADLLTGFNELCKPLREVFATFLIGEVFRKEAEERFDQLQSNIKLRQQSALNFLQGLGSIVVDDTTQGANHSDELMAGLQALPRPLQTDLAPYLEDDLIRAKVQERFAELGSNIELRRESALDFLNALGLGEETANEARDPSKDAKRRGSPPEDKAVSATEGDAPPAPGEEAAAAPVVKAALVSLDETVSGPGGDSPPAPGNEAAPYQGPAVDVQPPLQLPNSHPNFFDWTSFKSHTLDSTEDIMGKRYLALLALYDTVAVKVTAQGVGVELDGVARLIRHWLHKDDLLVFFRSVRRPILFLLDDSEGVDEEYFKDLDRRLFDTSKFNGCDTWLTSVTYGRSAYGTITLFQLTKAADRKPEMIRPVAAMRGVPKIVVEKVGEGIKGSTRTTLTMPHHEVWDATEQKKIGQWNGRVLKPHRVPHNHPSQANRTGDVLETALSMDDNDGPWSSVIATIPQMTAMLHHKTEVIENIRSTRVHDALEDGVGQPWVRMDTGPERKGYTDNSDRFHIIVLAPAKGKWVEEELAWK